MAGHNVRSSSLTRIELSHDPLALSDITNSLAFHSVCAHRKHIEENVHLQVDIDMQPFSDT